MSGTIAMRHEPTFTGNLVFDLFTFYQNGDCIVLHNSLVQTINVVFHRCSRLAVQASKNEFEEVEDITQKINSLWLRNNNGINKTVSDNFNLIFLDCKNEPDLLDCMEGYPGVLIANDCQICVCKLLKQIKGEIEMTHPHVYKFQAPAIRF